MPIDVKITSVEEYLSWIDSLMLFITAQSWSKFIPGLKKK